MATTKLALVAEDNAALCRVIGFALRKAGFNVTSASNGRIAWEAAQTQTFDLVVTDQQMPEMTGLELVDRLRESETNTETPVVLLTAKGMELELEKVRAEHGVAAMLHKPFSPTQLGALAETLIGAPV